MTDLAEKLIDSLCEDRATTLPKDILQLATKLGGKLIESPLTNQWDFLFDEDTWNNAHILGRYASQKHKLSVSYATMNSKMYRCSIARGRLPFG